MEPFVHLPEYPFAICQKCKVGFITSEVANHLKRKHGNISQKERQRIKQAVAICEGVAKDQAELQGWILPPPTISPNPYIKPPQEDGLGCDDCPYVVRDIQQMQKHHREQHGWVNHQKRGGRHRAQQEQPPVPWRRGVCCQQICHWGHGKRWFEVGRHSGVEGGTTRAKRPQEEEAGEADELQSRAEFLNKIQQEDREQFESGANAEIWKFEGRSSWGAKDTLADEVLHNFNELLFGEVCNDNGVIPNGTTDRLLLAEV